MLSCLAEIQMMLLCSHITTAEVLKSSAEDSIILSVILDTPGLRSRGYQDDMPV